MSVKRPPTIFILVSDEHCHVHRVEIGSAFLMKGTVGGEIKPTGGDGSESNARRDGTRSHLWKPSGSPLKQIRPNKHFPASYRRTSERHRPNNL